MTEKQTPQDQTQSATEPTTAKAQDVEGNQKQDEMSKLAAELESAAQKEASTSSKPAAKPDNKIPASKKENHKDTMKNTAVAKPQTEKTSISKTAIFALLLAVASGAGVGGLYYIQGIEHAKQRDHFAQQLTLQHHAAEQDLQKLLTAQEITVKQQLENAQSQLQQASQARIIQLEQQISRLEQKQPSDWLIHEAEYLIRIASRTLWLEQDTKAAINLLHDANARLSELNDPQYLPIRQVIMEDIEALNLLPTLDTEEVVLKLSGLSKQIPHLTFAMANIPDSHIEAEDLELTENAADWRSNLAKTWQRFMADFITVRRRTGEVEPLMSPQHQTNLKENLALKLQQAQWAASKQSTQLYLLAISDVKNWLTQYFDLGQLETAKFYQSVQMLSDKTISADFSNKLQALSAIRSIIKNNTHAPINDVKPVDSAPKEQTPTTNATEKEEA